MASPLQSNFVEWQFQLYDKWTNRPIDDDAGQFIAYTASTPVKATLYSDSAGTSLTQPGTLTNGAGRFYTTSSVASLDVTILTASGRSYFIEALTPSQHRVDVNPHTDKYTLCLGWAIKSAHGDGTVSALGFQLINGMRINDVFVQKQSAGVGVGAGLIVDFGVSGDPDGFVDGMTSTVTGWFQNGPVIASDTEGGSLIAATQLRGVLLQQFQKGLSTITASVGSPGQMALRSYMVSLATTTNNLVFAITGTSSLTTVAGTQGYVFYSYDLIRTAGN